MEQIKAEKLNGKFELGSLFITPGALEALSHDQVLAALKRHVTGDWGDCCGEDRDENELSLEQGFRLLSVYHSAAGVEFWVITEADRSSTTLLLPAEY